MKVVIAIDSLKGSLSSIQAGAAIREGILRAIPDAQIMVSPVADGGEGTVEALTIGMNGHLETITASDPLGRPKSCTYGILPDQQTAIIEMSAAAGLPLLAPEERNPLYTTTYGVGELIRDAISKGCRRFIIGIGGSATNDGGIGMLQALGYGILDKDGKQVPFGSIGLKEIVSITDTSVIPDLQECSFRIACDVNNPLCGDRGCSAIFGPQKGADASMVSGMDRWLSHYASLCAKDFPNADPNYPGAGAAGGLGFAFLTFTDSVLESGIKIVLEETGLESHIQDADLVVTGEGRLDAQTVMGKAPIGVAHIAQKYRKPVIAFAGCVTQDAILCNQHGIDAFFPILRNVAALPDVMEPCTAARNLADTAQQVFQLIQATARLTASGTTLPTRKQAEELLREAEQCNPGPWGNHSRVAAHCAEKIARACGSLDPEKAYILGLLHDIGRKFGVRHLGHVADGYSYMMSLGYDEAARVCLTHSFNTHTIDDYCGKFDTTKEELQMIRDALGAVSMDDYDRLIQLCDSLAGSEGVLDIEERMDDVKRRYGGYPQEKWDCNLKLKEYFEKKAGQDIYVIVEKDVFRI